MLAAAGSTATSGARAAVRRNSSRRSSASAAVVVRCQQQQQAEPSSSPTSSRRAALLLVPAVAATPFLFAAPRSALAEEAVVAAAAAAPVVGRTPSAIPSSLAPAGSAAPSIGAATFQEIVEPILAYSFRLPTATSKGEPLSLVPSRRPERYSSAAPLSADARQRIVAEWLDLKRFVSVTVTVGPAASAALRGKAMSEWKSRDVADAVLTDRSTGRLSSGQRTALMDVERTGSDDSRPPPTGRAWTYEYLSQGSPTVAERGRETYRHAVAVSAARYGEKGEKEGGAPYIWSISFTCPERLWPDMEGPFRAAMASFALTEPTKQYVAPDRESWRFF